MVNITAKNEEPQISAFPVDNTGPDTFKTRLGSFFFYLEYELLGSLANTLIIGIIAAGIIAAVIPDYFFEQYLNYPFLSLLIMLVIGIPMYVCASASTPIAASLIMKGMAPGAALVFLLTGPATNAVTISTIIRTLGKKTALIYILCISVVSLVLGQTLNIVSSNYGLSQIIMTHQHEILPAWLKISGSVLLSLMVLWYYFDTKILTNLKRTKNMEHNKIRFNVEGMECMHCSGSVKKAVMAVSGTSDITVNLDGKYVEFQINDPANIENVKSAISSAGYQLSYCKH
jgi:copper chaperone CopZ